MIISLILSYCYRLRFCFGQFGSLITQHPMLFPRRRQKCHLVYLVCKWKYGSGHSSCNVAKAEICEGSIDYVETRENARMHFYSGPAETKENNKQIQTNCGRRPVDPGKQSVIMAFKDQIVMKVVAPDSVPLSRPGTATVESRVCRRVARVCLCKVVSAVKGTQLNLLLLFSNHSFGEMLDPVHFSCRRIC